jgi:hypothetical protein
MSEKRMIPDVEKLKEKIDYIATHTCYPDIVPQDCERIKNIIDSLAEPVKTEAIEKALFKLESYIEDREFEGHPTTYERGILKESQAELAEMRRRG